MSWTNVSFIWFGLKPADQRKSLRVTIRKATSILNYPCKFWTTVQFWVIIILLLSCLPVFSRIHSKLLTRCLNEHFRSSGALFDFLNPIHGRTAFIESDIQLSGNSTLSFTLFIVWELHKALRLSDTSKSAGPDQLQPFFIHLAADLIASPLTYILNGSILSNEIPCVWKSVFFLPLFKGGDPTVLNNYHLIMICSG